MYATRIGLAAILSACAVAQAATVDKKTWMDGMATAVPTLFCAPKQYFRQCFKVSAAECEDTSASAVRVCLNKNKDQIPDVLNQPEDGQRLGNIIGRCAGVTYEIALMKKRSSDPKCNDPNNWR